MALGLASGGGAVSPWRHGSSSRGSGRDASSALALALGANSFNLGASLWFFALPAGISIRPMIWNFQVLSVAVVSVLVVAGLGLWSLFVAWGVLEIAQGVQGFRVATH